MICHRGLTGRNSKPLANSPGQVYRLEAWLTIWLSSKPAYFNENAALIESSCPICASSVARVLGGKVIEGCRWQLVRCRQCGQHYTNPRPTSSDICSFYSGSYHNDLLKEGASEQAFGPKFQGYIKWLHQYVRGGRSLDIGCATGLLPKMLRDLGFDAEGVEINPATSAWGRKHYDVKIGSKPLESGCYPANAYSLVTACDVIEHTENPLAFTRMIHDVVAPGGYVLVTFPDVRSIESQYWRFLAKATGRNWAWMLCQIPHHVWEFTYPTALRMFRMSGFRVVGFRRCHGHKDFSGLPKLKVAALPVSFLDIRWFGRRLGAQMEFILKKDEPSPAATAGKC